MGYPYLKFELDFDNLNKLVGEDAVFLAKIIKNIEEQTVKELFHLKANYSRKNWGKCAHQLHKLAGSMAFVTPESIRLKFLLAEHLMVRNSFNKDLQSAMNEIFDICNRVVIKLKKSRNIH